MSEFIKHYMNDMNESMIQNCIFCGETISDYSNAMWPSSQSAPKGFGAGEVYVSKGNPTVLTIALEEGTSFKRCTDKCQ